VHFLEVAPRFPVLARAQAVTEIFEWPELIAVTDLASAGRAVETIVEQGEGARGDWIRSHFGTFVGILEDLLAMQAADPAFTRPGRSSPPRPAAAGRGGRDPD
jgi:ferritin-like protein